ncbi:hypothetical protein [Litorihabitans aurantiacus]|uniref:Uncharacterized protein n=1 Tax=Litorihabitans aurantiacus TaxID=1930061 RepID=A0AA37XFZ2_9MICO|nr:hypothetical protein [Litorihabitans aurantiacus]GMA32567.1 hypothetical protein GCM10025875_25590 [Litorihabitans aurantiacus]
MGISGGRVRALALATAVTIVLAGCTSEQILPTDPAGAEPGYPQYTPPATEPGTSSPEGGSTETSDGAAPTGPDGLDTIAPPSPSPSPSPTPSSPDGGPTAQPEPSPTATETSAEPAPPPTSAPSSPAPSPTASPRPTTPPPSSSPTTPPPPPAQTTLITQQWQPQCGATLAAPARRNDLTVNVTLPAVTEGSTLMTEATVRNNGGAAIVAERYVTSVVVARDGVVVAVSAEGADAPENAISIAAGSTQLLPSVFHDLIESCATPGTASPEPPRSEGSGVASSGRTGVDDSAGAVSTSVPASTVAPPEGTPAPPSESVTPPGAPAPPPGRPDPTPAPTPGPLPAGQYTAVVAVHVLRDGGLGSAVVASSGIVPLTITAAG